MFSVSYEWTLGENEKAQDGGPIPLDMWLDGASSDLCYDSERPSMHRKSRNVKSERFLLNFPPVPAKVPVAGPFEVVFVDASSRAQ